jgi:hypothetical protein
LSVSAPVDAITKEGETFPSTDIDVGGGATDRASNSGTGNTTCVDRNNPANADGTLDTLEFWFWIQNGANVKAGTFSGSGTSWDDRDYETIGSITAGAKRTFTSLDIDVVTDDCLGFYCTAGFCEASTSGGSGYGTKSGDQFGSGTQTYTFIFTDDILSLYGTGETVVSCSEDISNTPSSENLGTVAESTTYYAKGSAPSNPVEDGECTFTITNSSGGAVDLTIKATNFTGGDGWTLTSNAPGSGTVRMTAYYSGQNPASGVVLTTSYQSFKTAVADAATLKWDFKLETGTFTDGTQKSSTITISAACSA